MSGATMRAVVLYGREEVRIERVPLPPVGPGEVRVRIGAALTCGTDVKVYRRGCHARMIRPPALFGHEFAGVIEAVGADVTEWRVGERVVAANSAPCGGCYYCRRERPELCENLLFLNGAYAEAITVPARIVAQNLLRLPDGIDYEEGALVEPLACVVHGMEASPVAPGSTAIVLGLGPIGLLFVRLCHLAGARVIAVGRRAQRLALAARLGADEVIDAGGCADPTGMARALTEGGRGADTVIEAVGTPEAWETAIALARKAGTVNLFGGCAAGTGVTLDTERVHYDELTIKGAFHHTPRAIRAALNLIAGGAVPAREFVGRRASLEELPRALAELADGRADTVKIGIYPDRHQIADSSGT